MKATIAMLGVALLTAPALLAQHEQHQHPASEQAPAANAQAATPNQGPHGGPLQSVGGLQIESVVEANGIRVFAYDGQGHPLDARGARGVAVLQTSGEAKRYRYDLFPDADQDGSAESLAVAVDLRRIAGTQVSIELQLIGLPGATRQPLRAVAASAVPMTPQQHVAMAIAEQKVCPVSGKPLGSMGEPIAVEVGDQTVYVCCASCVDKVLANPSEYVAKKPTLNAAPATESDAAAIATQKVCPVTDEPLGSMGTPIKVTGLERDVYLCCKSCLKSLEEQPQRYLAKLAPLPSAQAPVVKATEADAPFVAAQKLCPVLDEPLDSMGGPYRTVVEGRVVYLCCPACAKKLQADPQAYLKKLASQGVDPPAAQ